VRLAWKRLKNLGRILDEEIKTLEYTHVAKPSPQSVQKQWPETHAMTMVIDISDEEDEDE
jgi:hypothetical protein